MLHLHPPTHTRKFKNNSNCRAAFILGYDEASANFRRQHGHLPSDPLTRAERSWLWEGHDRFERQRGRLPAAGRFFRLIAEVLSSPVLASPTMGLHELRLYPVSF